jgi:glycosyltransferase involved in cell wall biosynthesis
MSHLLRGTWLISHFFCALPPLPNMQQMSQVRDVQAFAADSISAPIPNVTIDARWLSTGIGTYTLGFMRELAACGPIQIRALTMRENAERLSFVDSIQIVNTPIYTLREQFDVPRAAGHGLLHVPHYNVPLMYRDPLIVTIHDLTHVLDQRYSRTLRGRVYALPMLRAAARKAVHIVTVSHYTKLQIIERLGASDAKVTVAHNGVGAQFRPINREQARATIRAAYNVTRPFVLYLGNLKPHKNVAGLLRAFASSSELQRDIELLIVGHDAVGRDVHERQANEAGLAACVRFIPRVPAEHLIALYNAAEMVVLPSFEEGFGLPVIEAMACGTPVACSTAASLPEVAGNAAVLFDPNDPEQIRDAILTILHDAALGESLRARGFEQSRKFSWRKCAQLHYDTYVRYSR